MEHEWKHGEVGHRDVGGVVRTGVYVTRCERRHGMFAGGHWHTDGDAGWSTGTAGWRPALVTDPDSDEDLKTLLHVATGVSALWTGVKKKYMTERLAEILNPEPETCPDHFRLGGNTYQCAAPMPHGKGGHRLSDVEVTW